MMMNIKLNPYQATKPIHFRGNDHCGEPNESLEERYKRLRGKGQVNQGDGDKKNEKITLPQDLQDRYDCPADKYYGRSPESTKPKFEIPQDGSLTYYLNKQRGIYK